MSLTRGDFITDWKLAIVKPLLKKSGMEPLHRNYRPVSNLGFLCKLVEWCMLWEFLDHCTKNNLIPDFQSAYCKNYSTETNLLKLTNDLLWGFENQNITVSWILDPSTAFDTIVHDILLTILHDHFGIQDMALNWFKNYLRPGFFKVAVDSKHSSPREHKYGVPQGSCSWDYLLICYCSLIEGQIDSSITLTAFADDHSIHNNFKASDKEQEHKVKTDLEKTFTHLIQWMDMMCLKLNPDKTEYILFGSQQQLKKTSQEPLDAQGDSIAVSKVVRYLGRFLDRYLNLEETHKRENQKSNGQHNKNLCHMEVPNSSVLHHTHTDALHNPSWLSQCSALWSTIKHTKKIPDHTKHLAKLVLNKNRYSSSLRALKKLHWLAIQ